MALSEESRTDLMLEAFGSSDNQQFMVLTSVNNERKFDSVVGAVLKQHP